MSGTETTSCARTLRIAELLEHIHHFLSDDRTALTACSLTSHAWCTSAARHLMSKLYIEPHDTRPVWLPEGKENCPENKLIGEAAFDSRYAWLITRPRILNNVRHLLICPAIPSGGSGGIYPSLILDIMSRLPRLCNMTIYLIDSRVLDAATPITITSSLRVPSARLKLDQLTILSPISDPNEAHDREVNFLVQEVLANVAKVKSLCVGYEVIFMWFSEVAEDNGLLPRAALESFSMDSSSTDLLQQVFQALESKFDLSGLVDISLTEYKAVITDESYDPFIQTFMHQVEHLTLDLHAETIDHGNSAIVEGLQFDLSRLSMLRTVSMCVTISDLEDEQDETNWPSQVLWRAALQTILSAPADSLRSITLEICLYTGIAGDAAQSKICCAIRRLDWGRLGQVIDRQSQDCTVKIRFPIQGDKGTLFPFELVEDITRKQLPGRALRFSQSPNVSLQDHVVMGGRAEI